MKDTLRRLIKICREAIPKRGPTKWVEKWVKENPG
jgi:hypothetical protein